MDINCCFLSSNFRVRQLEQSAGCKNKGNMRDSMFADIYFSEFCSFIFKVHVEKVAVDEEELHGIEIDGFLNLLDNLSRTIFID